MSAIKAKKELIYTGKGIIASIKEEDRIIKKLLKTKKDNEIIIIGASGPKKIKVNH